MISSLSKYLAFVIALMVTGMAAAAKHPSLDEHSFADEVVSFHEGSPSARGKSNNAATLALGPPSRKQPSLTLGCGGVLVVRFVDNVLIDVAGPDLYIFEIGPDIEATQIDISMNGHDWINIGKVAGSIASLDIDASVKPGQSFSYVRLTDLRQSCLSDTPGADIAAIAAIGSATRYHFSAAVLFDFDQAELKPEAELVLQQWIQSFQETTGRLQINGHTDQRGSEAYNLNLSKKRAQAVSNFLQPHIHQTLTLEIAGLGESQPLVQGKETEDIMQNRRVEIIHFPN